jgi:transposase
MTQKIKLEESQDKELKERLKSERDAKIWRRLKCIDLKQKGHKHKEIAELLDVTIDTITDWLFLFNEGGFEELCKLNYDGRRVSVLEEHKSSIEEKIDKENIPTVKYLQDWLKKEFGVEIEHSWFSRWLKKNQIFIQKDPFNTRQSSR